MLLIFSLFIFVLNSTYNGDLKVNMAECTIKELSKFNDLYISPLMERINSRTFFRFYQLNISQECPFWSDSNICASECCQLNTCEEGDVPELIKENQLIKYFNTGDESWKEDEFWSGNISFYDLDLNPERYTGYGGSSSQRVWKAIYSENCDLNSGLVYTCVSGLHMSINLQLCGKYYNRLTGRFSPNIDEFYKRFYKNGLNQDWVHNIHFLYSLELSAIKKAADYLANIPLITGNSSDDEFLSSEFHQFLENCRKFQNSIEIEENVEVLKNLSNITSIINCVGCDKCKLWGNVQITGIKTSLRILMGETVGITRQEVVALFQAFGKISDSIGLLRTFVRRQVEKWDEL